MSFSRTHSNLVADRISVTNPSPPVVLHLDHTDERGGAELALARTLLVQQQWEAILCTSAPRSDTGGAFEEAVRNAGVRTIAQRMQHPPRLPGQQGRLGRSILDLGRTLLEAVSLSSHPAMHRVDVVHANTARAAVYGALLSTARRRPLVVSLRDIVSPDAIGAAGTMLMRRLVLPRAAAVVANSHTTLRSAQAFLRPGALAYVIHSPLGVDRVPEPTVTDPVRRIGMVARVDDWKGQDLVIRAFAASGLATDGVQLLFAGAPAFGKTALVPQLTALARDLGVEDHVEFLGHVADPARFIDEADICIQASTRPEPLGQNVLQYLLRGRPTVVSAEGGPAEWVHEDSNGLLFAPRDPSDLAAKLRALAGDRAMRERLARAAVRTPDLLTDGDVAMAYAQVFRDVAAIRSAGAQRTGFHDD